MRRTAARVVLAHHEGSSMVDHSVDQIGLRRAAHAKLAVWSNKFGGGPDSGCRRRMPVCPYDHEKNREMHVVENRPPS